MFLNPFLVAFSISTLILLIILRFFKGDSDIGERTSSRHIHKSGISRFGGIAIISAFVLTLLLDRDLIISRELFWVLVVSGLILIIGVWDDLHQLSWKKQLFFQLIIVLFIFFMGIRLEYITNPLGGIFLFEHSIGFVLNFFIVSFWMILIINAMNWVDGIDGLSGGISIIGALAIFFVSLRPEVNQPPIAIISMALAGAILAFVFFNFNPAKLMAGTSGSLFMGFILAVLALLAGAKIATTLLVLAIPVIDAIWVIMERLRSGSSIFKADRQHLHYRLIEIGWTQKGVCIFYWAITALVAVAALNSGAFGKMVIFGVVCVLMVCLNFFINRKGEIKSN